ncbi:MAG: hypothetical protein FJ224_02805 [Lentisphaerae bacterium]|nr:hypothetical protein [Lentisphaerota bacterium]
MTIRVDGETIPESAVEFEFRRLVSFYSQHMPPSSLREQADTLRKRAVDQAIGAKLLLKEADRLAAPVPEQEITARLASLVEQAGGEAAFNATLKKQRLTLDAVREGIARGRRVDRLVEQISAEVPEPTEDELLAHFEANRNEYIRPDRVQAQHILISAEQGDDAGRATARSRLEDIRERIASGSASFSDMAAAHSDCPSGKKSGGGLGWFSRGMMVPEFDSAVFSMQVGELSSIIDTQFGMHIIYKTAEEQGGAAEFSDARDRIRDLLRHARRGEALSAYVNELKAKAVIEGVDTAR